MDKDSDRDRKDVIKPISKHAIRNFMTVLLLHTGLRKIPTENHAKRLEVMMTHGCHKFLEKCIQGRYGSHVYPSPNGTKERFH